MTKIRSNRSAVRVVNFNSTVVLCIWGIPALLIIGNIEFHIWRMSANVSAPLLGIAINFILALVLRISHSRIAAVLLTSCLILVGGVFLPVIASDLKTQSSGFLAADAFAMIVVMISLWASLRATFATFKLRKYPPGDQAELGARGDAEQFHPTIDYYPVVARAVAKLTDKSTGGRQTVYERARNALSDQLRARDPPASEQEIERQQRALATAIKRIEDEHGNGPRRASLTEHTTERDKGSFNSGASIIKGLLAAPAALAAIWTMGPVPAFAFLVVSLGTAIFSVWWGAVVYAGAIYFGLATILSSLWSVRALDLTGARNAVLTPEEEQLFKRYYMFFLFPFGAQNYAHFVNYARMFGLIWIGIGLWARIYWVPIAIVVFYLISGLGGESGLMWRLSPIAHFKEGARRGLRSSVSKLAMMEKILENRDSLGF